MHGLANFKKGIKCCTFLKHASCPSCCSQSSYIWLLRPYNLTDSTQLNSAYPLKQLISSSTQFSMFVNYFVFILLLARSIWHLFYHLFLCAFVDIQLVTFINMVVVPPIGTLMSLNFSNKSTNQMQQILQVYYLTFMCRSTCFGRPHAHHQELTTALTASGFTVGAWW